MNRTLKTLALGAGLLFAGRAQALTLNGAGSTFFYPLASKWFYEYAQKTGVQINYQSIGSGGGIQQFISKTVDFGATDAPMTADMMAKAGGVVYHLPVTMGAVVVVYNVPGIASGLKLDSSVLAGIFLGEITNWNDPAIAALNEGKTFPDQAITVAHRADGSGTTNIFTDYLTKVNTKWAGTVGRGTAVKWPVGVGGKGNEAVAGLVKQIPGTIGYVELAYVLQNHMTYAVIKNRAGSYPDPSIGSVSAAADGALKKMPADFRVSFTNSPGEKSYPISGFTWVLVNSQMKGEKGKALVDFLNWSMDDGQKMAAGLNYAPLPSALVAKIKAKIAQIKY
jgi:phosphate transport system substrate-binding protein